jgi:uncharacterized protein
MVAALSQPVRSPQWVLIYQGINITADISAMVLSVSYTDQLSELSGEVEVVLEDHAHQWQSSWYPSLGDALSLTIGYRGEALLPCGDFQVDQLELSGPPDTFTIRCLAAYITPAMRTRNSIGYEGRTLLGIAGIIAGKYGLSLVSAPDVIDITFERITQKYETDLAFLKRLALEYGYDFTIRGSLLVFYSRSTLEGLPPLQTVTRTDLETFEFRNRTHSTYLSAVVAYHDPLTKSLTTQSAAAAAPIAAGDTLKIVSRCENGQQAALKAQAALHGRDMFFMDAILTMPGAVAMAAGSTIAISDFGEFDGIYIILLARHRLDRAHGYITQTEVTRVF